MNDATGIGALTFRTNRKVARGLLPLVAGAVLVAGSSKPCAAKVDQAIESLKQSNERAASSQGKIDTLADQTDALVAKYRAALQETRALRIYNAQLEGLIASQEKEAASLRGQIDRVTAVGRQVVPLMLRMIDALDEFVSLDVPFLLEERESRVAALRALMERADVTISEKYRRILEAYQIENEFGRTIEAYQGSLEHNGTNRTVDFLRIGRNAFLYQTLDGRESGVWDVSSKSWKTLDDGYRLVIRQGLRMARKQVAPDLVRIPMPAARAAR